MNDESNDDYTPAIMARDAVVMVIIIFGTIMCGIFFLALWALGVI